MGRLIMIYGLYITNFWMWNSRNYGWNYSMDIMNGKLLIT